MKSSLEYAMINIAVSRLIYGDTKDKKRNQANFHEWRKP